MHSASSGLTSRSARAAFRLACLLLVLGGCSDPGTPPEGTSAPAVTVRFPREDETAGERRLGVELSVTAAPRGSRVVVSIDGLPVDTLDRPPWEAVLDVRALNAGPHTLRADLHASDGSVLSAASRRFVRGAARVVLLELATSANCPPCAPANIWYDSVSAGARLRTRLLTIKHHVWWPRSTDRLWKEAEAWVTPRVNYLFHPSTSFITPTAFVNGRRIAGGGYDWLAAVDADLALAPEVRLDAEADIGAASVRVRVTAHGISTALYRDLRLHCAVLEHGIPYSDGNGETVHHAVLRRMAPDASGTPLTLGNGATYTLDLDIPLDPAWNRDALEVVAFVQSAGIKRVLQAVCAEKQ